MTAKDVDGILASTAEAWQTWRAMSFDDRGECFRRVADLLEHRADEFALLITREMGKPVSESRAEAFKCALVCRYFADEAAGLLVDREFDSDNREAFATFEPLGVIYAIMPWNLPFWQVFRAAAPTMMAGNGMVLKHAPCVIGCAMMIESLFAEAGFPPDIFRTLVIDLDLSQRVIDHHAVGGVTLTGSERAGRAVAAQAGAALKKSVLELGGSDPYVILEDADLELAAQTCVASRMLNCGQVCIAAKRFIAVDAIRPDLTERVIELMKTYEMGDPEDPDCRLGPMAREDLRDQHHDQVQQTINQGATCVLGGTVPDQPGWWYSPTVLVDVTSEMVGFTDELFGPTAAIVAARDEAQAIELANHSRYGLGGAVFTRDLDRGRALARDRVTVGCCAVNGLVKSDPRLPFGGVRDSGYGRELGPFGIHEFVNIKTVVVS
ncbi:MAG: NAD-dependent succinate-semialdehyde dehydrogenase [Phycisphaerales bacterium]|nr:NAD-dependent succinate-semialdehyde dehydrogenase [Phycisphaerales bacterium]